MSMSIPEWLLGVLLMLVPASIGLGMLWYRLQQREQAGWQAELQVQSAHERAERAQADLQRLQEEAQFQQDQLVDLQGDNAALRREVQLLQAARQEASRQRLLDEERRIGLESELRELAAERAALQAALHEQQQGHRQRLEEVQAARDTLRAQFAELAGQIFAEREQRFSQDSEQSLRQLLEPLRERLQHFEQRVEQSYQQEARERFSLGRELERLQQLNERLGSEAQDLARALRGQKTQGNWGELVLERVLEQAGLQKGREYDTQVSLRSASGERFQPDVLIRLPGERQVVVDAKVSLTAWQQYVSGEDEPRRQHALRQHVQSLRNHLRGLSQRDYQRLEGLNSLDFVLLFVPLESAFAAALQAEPELLRESSAQNIILVGPTTLLATLRLVDSLWRQERQSLNAREIAERAGALYDKFVLFIDDLQEIGTRLQQLDKAYAAARNKLCEGRGNLIGRSEQLRQLGARTSKQLPADWLADPETASMAEASVAQTQVLSAAVLPPAEGNELLGPQGR
ncbi:DNA recombination protein RmuC [Pseudomonas sp. NW5]|uniref:DNA recombination protein RmuC n=1 Tax=Pseudomonas sp. NW5 TaxID=2934934 RepID=UPI002021DFCB|nr:DNA recombination protein RmuC [Pseudomonas sp. NW5]MCL7461157.1 DNA recombination protein RmuC [Pseudomonas sp. NW5]